MDKIRILGGSPLHGEVEISGAKNAALPLMVASLLTGAPLTLSHVPQLADIDTLAKLLAELGVAMLEIIVAEVARFFREFSKVPGPQSER